jgi:hypothetical protein
MDSMRRVLISAILVAGALLAPVRGHGQDALLLELAILSSRTMSGTAGDYVTVAGQIKNAGRTPVDSITTYLSLVDTENKLPVDLEDWSAEKGLYVGTIEPGQTFPLTWKLRFVKAGTYALVIVATAPASETPCVSKLTHFTVASKRNLNPGNVLPVALGTPIVIALILSLIVYRRQRGVE